MAFVALARIPHWTKNGFVLAPLVFSKELGDAAAVGRAVSAFVVFSLVSSAVYALNDWMDREADARHPVKARRPLASGELTARDAAWLATACIGLALTVGLVAGLGIGFWAVIGSYLTINIAYSMGLRHVELVDVCVIASGFVLRVLAGTTALDVDASSWIILSTGLLAMLLALGKRRTDLAQEEVGHRRSLEGYSVEFIDAALACLAASVIGFYALFTVSDYAQERFGSHELYLTTFWVVVGILRYLQTIIAHGQLGSPTDIALRDRPLQVIVAGWIGTFWLLAYPLSS